MLVNLKQVICICILYNINSLISKKNNNDVNNYTFTSVFFKAACHANPGAKRNFSGSK